jgi:ribosomal protein S1
MKRINTLVVVVVVCFHTLALAHGDRPHVMGTVKALDAQQIVVQTKEGKTISIHLNEATKYRKEKATATRADLKVGDRVVVHATSEGDTLTASEIRFSSASKEKGHEEHEGHEGMTHGPTKH